MNSEASLDERLRGLGGAIFAATSADVARSRMVESGRRRGNRRRTFVVVLAAAAIAVPGAALAADALLSNEEVASSLPSGTAVLIGTQPSCTTIEADVSYDCVLASAPRSGDVPAGQWAGTVEETVDASKRVNGGCRSLNAEGTHWRCYIGKEAVRQGIIGAGFLGEVQAAPARG